MKQCRNQRFSLRLRRVLSGLLCAIMLCGLLPAGISLTGSAQAAEVPLSWTNEDLETLRQYDIMRGYEDDQMHPERTIRRAEFAAMINRALGYKDKAAKLPFKDVASKDWFADDISVSYNMGYLSGTSNTTVSPYGTLTREQALVILCRNLMIQPTVGEPLSYADSRSFSEWSRGYIDPAVEIGLIDADRTGSFNPRKAITRGEVAGLIVRAIGTPIQRAGVSSLGTVNGNVTITTSGVSLRNTTINGDLYLTGGIGLGDVLLDNVTVNGKIVDSGAGVSEKGENSVVLNNVTADELIVDSMRNQTVSLRTEGNTSIPKASIRTSARVDDSTSANYGLRLIEIDGEDKISVELSGNIEEVHDKTRDSKLGIGEGVANKVTIDEAATGSTLTLGKEARIKELNLDTGVKVSGGGYIDKLTVSANGTTVAQLPDEIIVRPGITANINKTNMDSAAAVEASSRPRLSSGYPIADNVTPNTATGLFSANKPGTIYWAVTALANGSPNEEDLISPPSYSKIILKYGKIQAKESNKEYPAKISGLTSDGDYYLSAIMEDSRGTRSAMKVTAFTTPDNTTPAFSKGYPEMSQISEKDAQVAVMTTKSCQLYYAVLPKGSTAPRAIDFQAGSISGNLGYGAVKMARNSPAYIFVNDVSLEEKQDYVLYLWLNDFDGAKSSAIKSLSFTTRDATDPIVSNLRQTKSTTTAVTASYSMNETGNLYWAVVRAGDESYKTPAPGYTTSNWLSSREAMERVIAGTGALKSGKSAVAASKVGTDISFTISGLNSKTTGTSAYDLYYVGVDAAGNWTKPVRSVTVYTDDKTAPTVVQKFTSFNEGETETTTRPLADTNIKLAFSKQVGATDVDGDGTFSNFLELYQTGGQSNRDTLTKLLRDYIKLYVGSGNGVLAEDKKDHPNDNGWVIDYSKATVYVDGTDMVVEFPNTNDPNTDALQLSNGETYYFIVSPQQGDIRDTTANRNPMNKTTLPKFTTMRAQINITAPRVPEIVLDPNDTTKNLEADFVFQLDPKSTSTSPQDIYYDIMIWSGASVTFDLYTRDNSTGSWGSWSRVNEKDTPDGLGAFAYTITPGTREYRTVAGAKRSVGDSSALDYSKNELKDLSEDVSYQYAVHIVTYNTSNERAKWNLDTEFSVTIASGNTQDLGTVAQGTRRNDAGWTAILNNANSSIESIGNPDPFTRAVSIASTAAPELVSDAPVFNMLDTSGTISIQLDQSPSTIYWLVSKLNTNASGEPVSDSRVNVQFVDNTKTFADVPHADDPSRGSAAKTDSNGKRVEVTLIKPDSETLISIPPENIPKNLYYGTTQFTKAGTSVPISLDDLEIDSWYGLYLMFGGNETSKQAVAYTFKTTEAITPVLSLSTKGRLDASVDATVAETNAKVTAWLLPTTTTNNQQVLTQTLKEAAPNANLSGYENMKVIEALTTTVSTTDQRSIFDKVTQENPSDAGIQKLTRDVADLILTGSNVGGSGMRWDEVIKIDRETRRGTENMTFTLDDRNVEYVCLAIAENTADSTKRSFAAITGVQIVDTTPPTAEGATPALYFEQNSTTNVVTLKGQVTVRFANYLYLKDGGNIAHPFTTVKKPATGDTSSFDDWYTVENIPGFGSNLPYSILTDTGNAPIPTRQFTIEVNQIIGTMKELPTNWTGYISLPDFCNRNGYVAANQQIEITYRNGSFTAKIVKGS